jgi:hypothetical protein
MDAAGVTQDDRPGLLALLESLHVEYPRSTPAKLFQRARNSGAPIPPAQCHHGVRRGQCVVCDARIGTRFYYTGGGTHVHSTPICEALYRGQEKVRRRGGYPEAIEVVRIYAGILDVRDPCRHCLGDTLVPASAIVKRPPPYEPSAPRPRSMQLSPERPPRTGQHIDWGGFSGPVTEIRPEGVLIAAGGLTMFIAWGEFLVVHYEQESC